jgi:catechol 2,3-dioxygenase-like lactoylglutathione lyase family enzyme
MSGFRLAHASVPATDLERARAFWAEKLGLHPASFLEGRHVLP